MTTTDTPRTDSALVDHMPECSEWSQHYLDLSTFARQIERELSASTAEVERLRELLSRAIEAIPDSLLDEDGEFYENIEHTMLKAELARIAPAPEEPDHFVNANKMIPTTEAPSVDGITPEWRELGPDEEIHTGDQVQAKHHDRLHGVWLDVFPYEVGAMPIDHEAFRYRTRRPKQL